MLFENSWFNSRGYLQGIFWMLMVSIVSCLNDVNAKYVGGRLSGSEVAFFRFFFSTLVLLPFMLARGKKSFVTQYPSVHFIRALLLVFAITAWSYGVSALPLTLGTTISFTTPFFVLPLAKIFLQERITKQRWIATIAGFIGILVSINPASISFNPMALTLVASTLLFASLDVINKKLLTEEESLIGMLFYSGLGTAILGIGPAILTWQTPTIQELCFLSLLGLGASLILFCVLKAFSATEISALQSFRYTELILSVIFGLIIFQEWPSINILFGAAIIIFATFYITNYETRT